MEDIHQATSRLPPGTLVDGRFVLIKPLGVGGICEVYKAGNRDTGDIVAIKLPYYLSSPDRPTTTEIRALLAQEACILSSLRHPCIPQLRGFKLHGENIYLAMDYIQGVTLDQLLEHNLLPFHLAVWLGNKICALVEFLHRQTPPVLHLDLKPGNIIINDGEVFLIDFGTAQWPGYTSLNIPRMGTLPYAPAEQQAGLSLDQRADVYALGYVLFDLLGDNVTPTLRRVLNRATALLPWDRYPSVSSFRSALNQVAEVGIGT